MWYSPQFSWSFSLVFPEAVEVVEGKKRERTGEVFQHSLFFRVCISKNREMASRFDSSSSGSSEDEEEAPQLDGMTSSEDEVFEDAFDDVYDDLDAGELEVRAMRRRASEQMTTDFPLASKTETKTHRFLHPISLSCF